MDTSPQTRLALREALRLDWTHLIGVAIFPSLFFVGFRYHVPFPVFILPFLAVAIHAGWPYLGRRAPYTFWLVSCGALIAGAVLGLILLGVINAIAVSPSS